MTVPSPNDWTLEQIVAIALAIGGEAVGGPFSNAERCLAREAENLSVASTSVASIRLAIRNGEDPLGAALTTLRSTEERRRLGQFFTDPKTVDAMVTWVAGHAPGRVVDAGCGSGRFAARTVQLLPNSEVIAVDSDPVATLIARANLAAVSQPTRGKGIRVLNEDFLSMSLEAQPSVTAFVGNPPYVRHHSLSPAAKDRGQALAGAVGHPISRLAGLHAYFMMQVANLAKPGDIGCFITSSEWLDVRYGRSLRALLSQTLGLTSLHLRSIDGDGEFEDALTSAVISCFEYDGDKSTVSLNKASSGEAFDLAQTQKAVPRDCLSAPEKWGALFRRESQSSRPLGPTLPLGDIFRVSRGVATGHNRFFVMAPEQAAWHSIHNWVTPIVSSASEIQAANGVLRRSAAQRVLLSVPRETRVAAAPELEAYLRVGEEIGVPARYICAHRNPWWAVQVPEPAPVVATYMGRRPPVFALNPDGLPLLNIALGLQPRTHLPVETMTTIVSWLNDNAVEFSGKGRTYQGGLQKFEPREMEELEIPSTVIDGSR